MLYIDKRESRDMIRKIVKLAKEKNIDYEIVTLKVADYVWDDYIAIERKTVADFVSSIRSGHLQTQLLDLEQYDKAFLIISGLFKNLIFNKWIKGWTVEHTIGALCSIASRYNVKVIQLENDTQVAKAIFKLKEKVDKGKKVEAIRHVKTVNSIDATLNMYLALPYVGIKKAKQLKKHYPTFKEFIEAFENNDLKIKLRKETINFVEKLVRE